MRMMKCTLFMSLYNVYNINFLVFSIQPQDIRFGEYDNFVYYPTRLFTNLYSIDGNHTIQVLYEESNYGIKVSSAVHSRAPAVYKHK